MKQRKFFFHCFCLTKATTGLNVSHPLVFVFFFLFHCNEYGIKWNNSFRENKIEKKKNIRRRHTHRHHDQCQWGCRFGWLSISSSFSTQTHSFCIFMLVINFSCIAIATISNYSSMRRYQMERKENGVCVRRLCELNAK